MSYIDNLRSNDGKSFNTNNSSPTKANDQSITLYKPQSADPKQESVERKASFKGLDPLDLDLQNNGVNNKYGLKGGSPTRLTAGSSPKTSKPVLPISQTGVNEHEYENAPGSVRQNLTKMPSGNFSYSNSSPPHFQPSILERVNAEQIRAHRKPEHLNIQSFLTDGLKPISPVRSRAQNKVSGGVSPRSSSNADVAVTQHRSGKKSESSKSQDKHSDRSKSEPRKRQNSSHKLSWPERNGKGAGSLSIQEANNKESVSTKPSTRSPQEGKEPERSAKMQKDLPPKEIINSPTKGPPKSSSKRLNGKLSLSRSSSVSPKDTPSINGSSVDIKPKSLGSTAPKEGDISHKNLKSFTTVTKNKELRQQKSAGKSSSSSPQSVRSTKEHDTDEKKKGPSDLKHKDVPKHTENITVAKSSAEPTVIKKEASKNNIQPRTRPKSPFYTRDKYVLPKARAPLESPQLKKAEVGKQDTSNSQENEAKPNAIDSTQRMEPTFVEPTKMKTTIPVPAYPIAPSRGVPAIYNPTRSKANSDIAQLPTKSEVTDTTITPESSKQPNQPNVPISTSANKSPRSKLTANSFVMKNSTPNSPPIIAMEYVRRSTNKDSTLNTDNPYSMPQDDQDEANTPINESQQQPIQFRTTIDDKLEPCDEDTDAQEPILHPTLMHPTVIETSEPTVINITTKQKTPTEKSSNCKVIDITIPSQTFEFDKEMSLKRSPSPSRRAKDILDIKKAEHPDRDRQYISDPPLSIKIRSPPKVLTTEKNSSGPYSTVQNSVNNDDTDEIVLSKIKQTLKESIDDCISFPTVLEPGQPDERSHKSSNRSTNPFHRDFRPTSPPKSSFPPPKSSHTPPKRRTLLTKKSNTTPPKRDFTPPKKNKSPSSRKPKSPKKSSPLPRKWTSPRKDSDYEPHCLTIEGTKDDPVVKYNQSTSKQEENKTTNSDTTNDQGKRSKGKDSTKAFRGNIMDALEAIKLIEGSIDRSKADDDVVSKKVETIDVPDDANNAERSPTPSRRYRHRRETPPKGEPAQPKDDEIDSDIHDFGGNDDSDSDNYESPLIGRIKYNLPSPEFKERLKLPPREPSTEVLAFPKSPKRSASNTGGNKGRSKSMPDRSQSPMSIRVVGSSTKQNAKNATSENKFTIKGGKITPSVSLDSVCDRCSPFMKIPAEKKCQTARKSKSSSSLASEMSTGKPRRQKGKKKTYSGCKKGGESMWDPCLRFLRPSDNIPAGFGIFGALTKAVGSQLQQIAMNKCRYRYPSRTGFYQLDSGISNWVGASSIPRIESRTSQTSTESNIRHTARDAHSLSEDTSRDHTSNIMTTEPNAKLSDPASRRRVTNTASTGDDCDEFRTPICSEESGTSKRFRRTLFNPCQDPICEEKCRSPCLSNVCGNVTNACGRQSVDSVGTHESRRSKCQDLRDRVMARSCNSTPERRCKPTTTIDIELPSSRTCNSAILRITTPDRASLTSRKSHVSFQPSDHSNVQFGSDCREGSRTLVEDYRREYRSSCESEDCRQGKRMEDSPRTKRSEKIEDATPRYASGGGRERSSSRGGSISSRNDGRSNESNSPRSNYSNRGGTQDSDTFEAVAERVSNAIFESHELLRYASDSSRQKSMRSPKSDLSSDAQDFIRKVADSERFDSQVRQREKTEERSRSKKLDSSSEGFRELSKTSKETNDYRKSTKAPSDIAEQRNQRSKMEERSVSRKDTRRERISSSNPPSNRYSSAPNSPTLNASSNESKEVLTGMSQSSCRDSIKANTIRLTSKESDDDADCDNDDDDDDDDDVTLTNACSEKVDTRPSNRSIDTLKKPHSDETIEKKRLTQKEESPSSATDSDTVCSGSKESVCVRRSESDHSIHHRDKVTERSPKRRIKGRIVIRRSKQYDGYGGERDSSLALRRNLNFKLACTKDGKKHQLVNESLPHDMKYDYYDDNAGESDISPSVRKVYKAYIRGNKELGDCRSPRKVSRYNEGLSAPVHKGSRRYRSISSRPLYHDCERRYAGVLFPKMFQRSRSNSARKNDDSTASHEMIDVFNRIITPEQPEPVKNDTEKTSPMVGYLEDDIALGKPRSSQYATIDNACFRGLETNSMEDTDLDLDDCCVRDGASSWRSSHTNLSYKFTRSNARYRSDIDDDSESYLLGSHEVGSELSVCAPGNSQNWSTNASNDVEPPVVDFSNADEQHKEQSKGIQDLLYFMVDGRRHLNFEPILQSATHKCLNIEHCSLGIDFDQRATDVQVNSSLEHDGFVHNSVEENMKTSCEVNEPLHHNLMSDMLRKAICLHTWFNNNSESTDGLLPVMNSLLADIIKHIPAAQTIDKQNVKVQHRATSPLQTDISQEKINYDTDTKDTGTQITGKFSPDQCVLMPKFDTPSPDHSVTSLRKDSIIGNLSLHSVISSNNESVIDNLSLSNIQLNNSSKPEEVLSDVQSNNNYDDGATCASDAHTCCSTTSTDGPSLSECCTPPCTHSYYYSPKRNDLDLHDSVAECVISSQYYEGKFHDEIDSYRGKSTTDVCFPKNVGVQSQPSKLEFNAINKNKNPNLSDKTTKALKMNEMIRTSKTPDLYNELKLPDSSDHLNISTTKLSGSTSTSNVADVTDGGASHDVFNSDNTTEKLKTTSEKSSFDNHTCSSPITSSSSTFSYTPSKIASVLAEGTYRIATLKQHEYISQYRMLNSSTNNMIYGNTFSSHGTSKNTIPNSYGNYQTQPNTETSNRSSRGSLFKWVNGALSGDLGGRSIRLLNHSYQQFHHPYLSHSVTYRASLDAMNEYLLRHKIDIHMPVEGGISNKSHGEGLGNMIQPRQGLMTRESTQNETKRKSRCSRRKKRTLQRKHRLMPTRKHIKRKVSRGNIARRVLHKGISGRKHFRLKIVNSDSFKNGRGYRALRRRSSKKKRKLNDNNWEDAFESCVDNVPGNRSDFCSCGVSKLAKLLNEIPPESESCCTGEELEKDCGSKLIEYSNTQKDFISFPNDTCRGDQSSYGRWFGERLQSTMLSPIIEETSFDLRNEKSSRNVISPLSTGNEPGYIGSKSSLSYLSNSISDVASPENYIMTMSKKSNLAIEALLGESVNIQDLAMDTSTSISIMPTEDMAEETVKSKDSIKDMSTRDNLEENANSEKSTKGTATTDSVLTSITRLVEKRDSKELTANTSSSKAVLPTEDNKRAVNNADSIEDDTEKTDADGYLLDVDNEEKTEPKSTMDFSLSSLDDIKTSNDKMQEDIILDNDGPFKTSSQNRFGETISSSNPSKIVIKHEDDNAFTDVAVTQKNDSLTVFRKDDSLNSGVSEDTVTHSPLHTRNSEMSTTDKITEDIKRRSESTYILEERVNEDTYVKEDIGVSEINKSASCASSMGVQSKDNTFLTLLKKFGNPVPTYESKSQESQPSFHRSLTYSKDAFSSNCETMSATTHSDKPLANHEPEPKDNLKTSSSHPKESLSYTVKAKPDDLYHVPSTTTTTTSANTNEPRPSKMIDPIVSSIKTSPKSILDSLIPTKLYASGKDSNTYSVSKPIPDTDVANVSPIKREAVDNAGNKVKKISSTHRENTDDSYNEVTKLTTSLRESTEKLLNDVTRLSPTRRLNTEKSVNKITPLSPIQQDNTDNAVFNDERTESSRFEENTVTPFNDVTSSPSFYKSSFLREFELSSPTPNRFLHLASHQSRYSRADYKTASNFSSRKYSVDQINPLSKHNYSWSTTSIESPSRHGSESKLNDSSWRDSSSFSNNKNITSSRPLLENRSGYQSNFLRNIAMTSPNEVRPWVGRDWNLSPSVKTNKRDHNSVYKSSEFSIMSNWNENANGGRSSKEERRCFHRPTTNHFSQDSMPILMQANAHQIQHSLTERRFLLKTSNCHYNLGHYKYSPLLYHGNEIVMMSNSYGLDDETQIPGQHIADFACQNLNSSGNVFDRSSSSDDTFPRDSQRSSVKKDGDSRIYGRGEETNNISYLPQMSFGNGIDPNEVGSWIEHLCNQRLYSRTLDSMSDRPNQSIEAINCGPRETQDGIDKMRCMSDMHQCQIQHPPIVPETGLCSSNNRSDEDGMKTNKSRRSLFVPFLGNSGCKSQCNNHHQHQHHHHRHQQQHQQPQQTNYIHHNPQQSHHLFKCFPEGKTRGEGDMFPLMRSNATNWYVEDNQKEAKDELNILGAGKEGNGNTAAWSGGERTVESNKRMRGSEGLESDHDTDYSREESEEESWEGDYESNDEQESDGNVDGVDKATGYNCGNCAVGKYSGNNAILNKAAAADETQRFKGFPTMECTSLNMTQNKSSILKHNAHYLNLDTAVGDGAGGQQNSRRRLSRPGRNNDKTRKPKDGSLDNPSGKGPYSHVESIDDVQVQSVAKDRVRFACDENGDWAEIGRGSYGCVYLGLLDGAVEVAIKDFFELNSYDQVIHEARMLAFLQDTGITPRFYGLRKRFDTTKQPGEFCIIMEYFGEGKTLFNVLSEKIELTFDEWLDVLGQLVTGLRLIHHRNILLNDLKADNILIDLCGNRKSIRYIDVGMATYQHGLTFLLPEEQMGKYNFLAPEVRNGAHTTKKSDIYSLGYMLDQMTRQAGLALSGLDKIVEMCMDVNPKQRPNIDQITNQVQRFIMAKNKNRIMAMGSKPTVALSSSV